jgi:hypothetical protein
MAQAVLIPSVRWPVDRLNSTRPDSPPLAICFNSSRVNQLPSIRVNFFPDFLALVRQVAKKTEIVFWLKTRIDTDLTDQSGSIFILYRPSLFPAQLRLQLKSLINSAFNCCQPPIKADLRRFKQKSCFFATDVHR